MPSTMVASSLTTLYQLTYTVPNNTAFDILTTLNLQFLLSSPFSQKNNIFRPMSPIYVS